MLNALRTVLAVAMLAFMPVAAGLIVTTEPASAGPVINKPPASQPLKPWQKERMALCQNGLAGGGLKPELTNPSCKRWHVSEAGSQATEEHIYTQQYPKSCFTGGEGLFGCYFKGEGKDVCRYMANVRTLYLKPWKYDANGNQVPDYFCGTGAAPPPQQGVPPMFRCAYCRSGEPANLAQKCKKQNGQPVYLPGEVCGEGTTLIELVDIVDEDVSYCNTPVSGPYSNFDNSYTACGASYSQAYRGMVYTSNQKKQITDINRAKPAHGGKVKSDFAGFCYPKGSWKCDQVAPGICKEPFNLAETHGKWNSPEVHHIVPKKDTRSCPCGKNSMSNAAVISKSLNAYLTNSDRAQIKSICPGEPQVTEVQFANTRPKYVP